ncbi:MAG TPA: alkaline phosphatase family protein [Rhodanobacteraceae bacterium]|nr:alkaline phosphatase family protein [Rhodanobacteraceae bacterium]
MKSLSTRSRGAIATALLLLAASASGASTASAIPLAAPVRHVFVIVLENEPYAITFGKQSLAPYLAHALPAQGALLPQYYGIGHYSLDNYLTMISGQAPNPATQDDCPVLTDFVRSAPGLDANGQARGSGCVYPADVKTVADQLDAAGLDWKGYMEDMGADPAREAATCGHVAIGADDITNHAAATDQYADKHNPFVYFHSIIDDPVRCAQHVVNLDRLAADLQSVATTPNLAFITPNLCHDGHDAPCRNGEPGGLVSADAFLREWVPRILAAPAFRQDGLLVITFDEGTDAAACCGEQALPGGPAPGQFGPGGGRIGAVLLSPFIAPGTVSHTPYNHYSLLRSIEDFFGLAHLGYAAAPQLRTFGDDVFTAPQRGTR